MIDVAAADELLTTTRAVRRRLDLERPVPREVLVECVAVAQQAPTGGNRQGWHFVIVTDPDLRVRLAEVYRRDALPYLQARQQAAADPQTTRVHASARYLAENLERVPVHVIPCIQGRLTDPAPGAAAGFYGSILPAVWNFVLALRARGLGTSWTTLHLRHEKEVGELLGIPQDVTQVALLPVAYYTGETFSRADRPSPETITHWNGWSVRD